MRYYLGPNYRRRLFAPRTPVTGAFAEDTDLLKQRLANLPTFWEGKASAMELREAGDNADRTDWWVAYFEALCLNALRGEFEQPGDRVSATEFPLKRNINWGIKAKAIRSDSQTVVLNDVRALRETIRQNGEAGVVLALCDVEYGDTDGEAYTPLNANEPRTSVSRYRITSAALTQILLLRLTQNDLPRLCKVRQALSGDTKTRSSLQYALNIEQAHNYLMGGIVF